MILNKSKIEIVKGKNSGLVINQFKNDSKWGYVQLTQTVTTLNGVIPNAQKRSFLMRQEIEVLKGVVEALKVKGIEGTIIYHEISEKEARNNAQVLSVIGKDEQYWDSYVKRPIVDKAPSKDECYYAEDGSRVLRVAMLVGEEDAQDILIQNASRATDVGNYAVIENEEEVNDALPENKEDVVDALPENEGENGEF